MKNVLLTSLNIATTPRTKSQPDPHKVGRDEGHLGGRRLSRSCGVRGPRPGEGLQGDDGRRDAAGGVPQHHFPSIGLFQNRKLEIRLDSESCLTFEIFQGWGLRESLTGVLGMPIQVEATSGDGRQFHANFFKLLQAVAALGCGREMNCGKGQSSAQLVARINATSLMTLEQLLLSTMTAVEAIQARLNRDKTITTLDALGREVIRRLDMLQMTPDMLMSTPSPSPLTPQDFHQAGEVLLSRVGQTIKTHTADTAAGLKIVLERLEAAVEASERGTNTTIVSAGQIADKVRHSS